LKIAIFGVEGQLGRDLQAQLSDFDVVEMLYESVDITDGERVRSAVDGVAPDWVINAAAMTHVDRCESERDLAFAVNAEGARHVARAAAANGAKLIHISTDYVFDGKKTTPYVETDTPGPINVYGESKLGGEKYVESECPLYYIVRTSGLYGRHECWGKRTTFVRTMLRLARDHTRLKVVNDEVLTPTYTEELASHVRRIVENHPPAGIYHATNEGRCSWFDFATEIFRLSNIPIEIEPIPAAEWGAPARRPAWSVLDNGALEAAGLNGFTSWKDALARYLASGPASG
jgi:dTDP-4-dehydrorhamnose reductase